MELGDDLVAYALERAALWRVCGLQPPGTLLPQADRVIEAHRRTVANRVRLPWHSQDHVSLLAAADHSERAGVGDDRRRIVE